jgi:hypothetical protein
MPCSANDAKIDALSEERHDRAGSLADFLIGIVGHPGAPGLFANALMTHLLQTELCSVPDSQPIKSRAG